MNRLTPWSSFLTIRNHIANENCPQLLYLLNLLVFLDIIIYVHFIGTVFLEAAGGFRASVLIFSEAVHSASWDVSPQDASANTGRWETVKWIWESIISSLFHHSLPAFLSSQIKRVFFFLFLLFRKCTVDGSWIKNCFSISLLNSSSLSSN